MEIMHVDSEKIQRIFIASRFVQTQLQEAMREVAKKFENTVFSIKEEKGPPPDLPKSVEYVWENSHHQQARRQQSLKVKHQRREAMRKKHAPKLKKTRIKGITIAR